MSSSTGLAMSSSSSLLVWATTALALLAALVYISRNLSKRQTRTSISIPTPTTKTPFKPTLNGLQKAPKVHDGTSSQVASLNSNEIKVTKIYVHPIKSCRGLSANECRYTPAGLENDRKWCIVDAQTYAIITAREISKLVLITPRFEYDSTSPHKGLMVVTVPKEDDDPVQFAVPLEPTPDMLMEWPIIEECNMFGSYKMDAYICGALSPTDPTPSQVVSDYLGKDVYFVMKGPTRRPCPPTSDYPELDANTDFQDGFPLLVASEESLWAVENAVRRAASCGPTEGGKVPGIDRGRWYDGELEMERFRPNIVVQGSGKPFSEDSWSVISVSSEESNRKDEMMITFVSKCARCMLPNVDPQTGIKDSAVPYKVLMKFRTGVDPANMNKPCFGCNGVVVDYGIIRVGDSVKVLSLLA